MDYKAPLETYSGRVKEVVVGAGDKAIKSAVKTFCPFIFSKVAWKINLA